MRASVPLALLRAPSSSRTAGRAWSGRRGGRLGCQMCMLACPFGNIEVGSDGQAEKCDLCDGDPQCVKFCARAEPSLPSTPNAASSSGGTRWPPKLADGLPGRGSDLYGWTGRVLRVDLTRQSPRSRTSTRGGRSSTSAAWAWGPSTSTTRSTPPSRLYSPANKLPLRHRTADRHRRTRRQPLRGGHQVAAHRRHRQLRRRRRVRHQPQVRRLRHGHLRGQGLHAGLPLHRRRHGQLRRRRRRCGARTPTRPRRRWSASPPPTSRSPASDPPARTWCATPA